MNKVKFILEPKYSDLNGHISEAGYLTIANEAIWKIFDSIGLIEIFLAEKIGPIIFATQLHFKKEAMAGEEVLIPFKAKLYASNRKILRKTDILNQAGEVAVQITSNGAFLNLKKRKVIPASDKIIRKFNKFLIN